MPQVVILNAGGQQTLGTVLPRSRGGKSTWLNTVAACFDCNGRKADRKPDEAGMVLQVRPYVPTLGELKPARYK